VHEHGLVDRLVKKALAEADRRGARLRGVRVRLGAMATVGPDALRRDFDHLVREHLGLDVTLEIEEAPDHPAELEIVGLDLAR
jgi:Zn finger protein HypA/HybF involved in hydrogenase expression